MDSRANAIPADVRFQAENMFALMPEPPRELLPVELICNERYYLFLSPMPSANMVGRIRVEADALRSTVDEVCELLRSRGRNAGGLDHRQRRYTRRVGRESAGARNGSLRRTPAGIHVGRYGNRHASIRLNSEGIEAREVRDHEEVDQFIDVEQSAVGLTRADSDGMRTAAHMLFDLRLGGAEVMRLYLASRDGEPVGTARALFLRFGVNLSGGAVAPAARSQGVYRALINARWNDAVAAGTPALTVQAGHMSRPILDRLGFVTVSQITTSPPPVRLTLSQPSGHTSNSGSTDRAGAAVVEEKEGAGLKG